MKIKYLIAMVIGLPFLLGLNDSSLSNYLSHASFVISMALVYALTLFNTRKTKNNGRPWLCAIFGISSIYLAWIYGIVLGLINGALVSDAVFNFLSIYAYIFYLFLWKIKPSPSIIIKTISVIVLISTVYSLFILLLRFSEGFYYGRDLVYVNDIRAVYSLSSLGSLPILALLCWAIYVRGENPLPIKILSYIAIFPFVKIFIRLSPLLFSACIFLSTFSKGFALSAVVVLLVFVVGTFLSKLFFKGVISINLLITILVILILLIRLLDTELGMIFERSISADDISNSIRSEQGDILSNEFTLFGTGFGVKLSSGYFRESRGIIFELMYHNIIHKLGIFSALLLIPIGIWFSVSIRNMWQRNLKGCYSAFAFGVFSIGFLSYGNHVLFSLQSVILQCCALYLLTRAHGDLGKMQMSFYSSS
jgi:hypothetical protein